MSARRSLSRQKQEAAANAVMSKLKNSCDCFQRNVNVKGKHCWFQWITATGKQGIYCRRVYSHAALLVQLLQ